MPHCLYSDRCRKAAGLAAELEAVKSKAGALEAWVLWKLGCSGAGAPPSIAAHSLYWRRILFRGLSSASAEASSARKLACKLASTRSVSARNREGNSVGT
jgi:hypothetical protein